MGRPNTGALGRQAEQLAFEYLLGRGLRPVARNFQRRGGEIDLIMLDDCCLCFVEVRFRSSSHFSQPGQTVDHRKQRKIIRTAALYIAKTRKFANHTMRFDVVAVVDDSKPGITWIRDAFRPDNSTL